MTTRNVPIDSPPGVRKTDSPNAAKGRYTDSDKFRFVAGGAQKWRGWQKFITDQLLGTCRSINAFVDADDQKTVCLGDEYRLYGLVGDDTMTNITPVRDSGSLGTDPFNMQNTDDEVIVTDANHGITTEGTYVTFGGATDVGSTGITVDGEYTVTSITDANTYVITHSSAATGTDTANGGASVTYSYEIDIGSAGSVEGLGWGAGNYNEENYGDARTSGIITLGRQWFLEEYGNEMLCAYSDGSLYQWDADGTSVATIITNSPSSCRAMFVTGERYPFMLGTTTAMTVQWPDVDTITNWTPSATVSAGNRILQSGNHLVAGTRLYDLTNLVWSDTSVYVFQYNGGEFVYDSRLGGTNCGLIGPKCFTVVNGVAYWLSGHDAHMYHGSVQTIPNFDDIKDWLFKNTGNSFNRKFWMGYNAKDHELVLGYVSSTSADDEPDRYVAANMKSWAWNVGTLTRTAQTVHREALGTQLMVGVDKYIYEHEVGKNADGAAMDSYIKYGLFSEENGKKSLDIVGFIPDFTTQVGNIDIELATYDRPQSTSTKDSLTTTVAEGDEIEDIRLDGRHFSFTIRSNELLGDCEIGIPSLEVVSGSGGERR